jgi:hypothetical protein
MFLEYLKGNWWFGVGMKMKRWLAFLFVLSAVWLLAATPERKVVSPFAAPFTNNSLNQYIGITTPGYENILGAALATNSVTVNGGLADRKGEYFHWEISVANVSVTPRAFLTEQLQRRIHK